MITTRVRTIVDVLRVRAEQDPDAVGYTFLEDGESETARLTYRELADLARARAALLTERGLAGGRVLLAHPAGLEFVATLLGGMWAGVTTVPVPVPGNARATDRLVRIARSAAATTVLTCGVGGDRLSGSGLTVIDTAATSAGGAGAPSPPNAAEVALLQYTSGSTGDPRGVMVTHANFVSNITKILDGWPCEPDSTVVSWLPHFHDMGLLLGVLLPLWAGVPTVLMPPSAFVRRPIRWLEAISRYAGTHSAAPSFAYELCVRAAEEGKVGPGLDLSSWRAAGNGAEPVRWQVLRSFVETFAGHGFRSAAMSPGYGLAESTLKVSSSGCDAEPAALWLSAEALRAGRVEVREPSTPGAQPIVACGAPANGTTVRMVDPATSAACRPGQVGEIWASSACVAAGYGGLPEESERTFKARIAGEDKDFLRTGDLGFLHEGQLYVTGRLKDVIIRHGRNHYPQDIELLAEAADGRLRPNCAAAFPVDDGTAERLVVVVEAENKVLREPGPDALRQLIRDAVWAAHRLEVDEVLLTRRGAVPKTSSGKVRRRACRDLYLAGALPSATAGKAGVSTA